MTTPSIQFRDAFGNVTITGVAPTLNNWLPDVDEICDRQVPQGTGIEEFWRYRRDFWASFEMPHIPAADLGKLIRLKSHLLTGGAVVVNTNDSASRVYTCSIKPGSTPSWQFSDRTNLEYTLTLELRNFGPYPMICDYSSCGGTSGNLIVNGGGETGTVGNQASPWRNDAGGQKLAVASDQWMFGSRSLSHTNTSLIRDQRSAQVFNLESGAHYWYSGWVRLDGEAGDVARLVIYPPENVSFGTMIRKQSTNSAGLLSKGTLQDFAFCGMYFQCLSADDTSAYLMTITNGAAQAWFDGVRLEKVPFA